MLTYLKSLLLVMGLFATTLRGGELETNLWGTSRPDSKPVVVKTLDGRELVGAVDDRTTDTNLWLRIDTKNISYARSIPWSEVTSLVHNGNSIDRLNFVQRSRRLATRRAAKTVIAPPRNQTYDRSSRSDQNNRRSSGRVSSLQVEAYVANNDADARDDQIVLQIAPVDRTGNLVAVRGEVTVRLFGVRHTARHTRSYEQLGQWSAPIGANDFRNGAAAFPMSLRGLEIERDTDVGPLARVHVRLGVFGSGAYEATAPVRLRAFDPLADELQLQTGSRFFRGERAPTGRAQQPVGDGLFFSAPVGP